jgi:hypothetical protein
VGTVAVGVVYYSVSKVSSSPSQSLSVVRLRSLNIQVFFFPLYIRYRDALMTSIPVVYKISAKEEKKEHDAGTNMESAVISASFHARCTLSLG